MNSNRTDELKAEVEKLVNHYDSRKRWNDRTYTCMTVGAIMSAAGVSCAGFAGHAQIAGLLGILVGVLVGLQKAFPLSDKAEFYRLVVVEGRNLVSDITYNLRTDADFERAVHKLKTLRMYVAASRPKGQGMAVVRDMSIELREKSG